MQLPWAMSNAVSTTRSCQNTSGNTLGKYPQSHLNRHVLTSHSAWWGESFVTELRRISETPDRKVHFANAPVAGVDDATKTTGETSSELPIRQETGNKDKESDPAAAIDAQKETTDGASSQ